MTLETVTEAQSVAETIAAADERAPGPATGAHETAAKIGRYIVLGALGEGGMGVVYAAYDPELDRKVALKVLLRGRSGSARAHERLLREAQALARLSHPNVVAVHDVGTHDGRVFIAMEFIAGATLTATVAAERPDAAAILRLYRAAGQGLAAAHRAGLVHRDFKPDNVMVDPDGRVRVVDFGLALAAAEASPTDSLVPGATNHSNLTMTGALMGTPAYMAPEQHLGAATDARTDIFAFCVALYEHLYGERPFAGDSVVRVAAEVLEGRIREAPRGSKVPRALRRVLLRGLARDPQDRHPTMDALLAELDAALAAPTRRRLFIAGGVALALGLAALAFGLHTRDEVDRCDDSAALIAAVWSPQARDAGAQAFATSGLSYRDDAWSRVAARLDAWTREWSEARDRACLDARERGDFADALRTRRDACFDQQRARLEVIVELLADADAEIIARIGELTASLPPAHDCSAAAVLRALEGPAPPSDQLAPAVDQLRRRLAAASVRFRATFADPELAAIEAIVPEARALGYRPVLAEAAALAAEANLHRGRADQAEAHFLDALTEAEAIGDARRLAAIWPKWIIFLVKARSAFDEARRADRRADAILERVGADEVAQFNLLEARAVLARSVEDRPRARRESEAAIQLGERIFGADSLKLADLHNNLGGALIATDIDAAVEHIERALAIWERELGPQYPKIGYSYFNLARAASQRKDHAEAERLYRAALERFEQIDPDHPNIGAVLNNIATVLEELDDYDRALIEYRRALAHLRRTSGEQHDMTATSYLTTGTAEARAGNLVEARRYLETGLELRRKLFGPDHADVLLAEARYLDFLLDDDDLDAARALADRLLAAAIAAPVEPTSPHRHVYPTLARARLLDRRPREALELVTRARALASMDRDTAAGLDFTEARALVATDGDRARARELAQAAAEFWRRYPRYYRRELAELDAFLAELDHPAKPGASRDPAPSRR
jgi:tetratricopeptide (TPR) repeat protein/predicted Ser/Thr protein kinase